MTDDVIIEVARDGRVVNIGGRWLRDVEVTVPDEWLAELAAGYRCLSCLEPLPEAYPAVCPLRGCGYEVARLQRGDLDRDYRGQLQHDVPSLEASLAASRAHLKERGVWLPTKRG